MSYSTGILKAFPCSLRRAFSLAIYEFEIRLLYQLVLLLHSSDRLIDIIPPSLKMSRRLHLGTAFREFMKSFGEVEVNKKGRELS